MKKLLSSITLLMVFITAFSQDKGYIKSPSLGINFFFNDFTTASNINSSSLSSTLLNKKFGKINDMAPGLGFSFLKGISSNLDFVGTVGGSFLDYTAFNGKSLGTGSFLLEMDASFHAKMLPDNYVVVPYLTAGVGLSKYKGYYGAIIPVGAGLQINILNDTYLMINSQYRIKVTESTNYHFLYSIGIVGSLKSL